MFGTAATGPGEGEEGDELRGTAEEELMETEEEGPEGMAVDVVVEE